MKPIQHINHALPINTPPVDFKPMSDDERAAYQNDYLERSLAQSARDKFDQFCPKALHPKSTMLNHPDLAHNAEAISSIVNWKDKGDGKGLLICGPTGTGKTRIELVLAERLMCQSPRHDVAYYTSHQFFAKLQDQITYGCDHADEFIETVARRKHLFIDDLGQQALVTARAPWANSRFFQLLDIRMGLQLPLFITTNLTAEQLIAGADPIQADPMLRRLLALGHPVHFKVGNVRAHSV